MEIPERQSITEILASKVNAEGAALLLALMRAQRQTEAPNVSEPRIERVPGWTDQLIEQNDRLKQEKQNLEQDLYNITAVLDATHPYENPLVPETLLNRVKRVALAASNQVTAKGWRYPKPGDKLRVVNLSSGAPGITKIGQEVEASQYCQITHYDAETGKNSYAVCYKIEGSEACGVIPLDCVEPA